MKAPFNGHIFCTKCHTSHWIGSPCPVKIPEPPEKLRETIDAELSQYGSSLLAWKSWGSVAVDKAHDLKVEAVDKLAKIIDSELLSLIPTPELKVLSEEEIEAILVENCDFVACKLGCTPADKTNCWGKQARALAQAVNRKALEE